MFVMAGGVGARRGGTLRQNDNEHGELEGISRWKSCNSN